MSILKCDATTKDGDADDIKPLSVTLNCYTSSSQDCWYLWLFENPSQINKEMVRTKSIYMAMNNCDIDLWGTGLNIERDTSSHNGGHLW